MTKIIFLKPKVHRSELTKSALDFTYNVKSNTVEQMVNHLYENKEGFREHTHPARCQAMGRMKQLGWTIKSDVDIHGNQPCDSDIFLERYDLDPHEWNIIKYEPTWAVYIPPGYDLVSIPTLYHSGRFFTFPGIIDGNEGLHFMNSFIVIKRDEIIPAGSPIAQWFLHKKEEKPEIEIREPDVEDIAGSIFKTNMCSERDDFLLAKKNKLFYNPLYEEEDYDG